MQRFSSFKTFIFIFIFLVFFVTLRWSSFNAPLERDEGEYAYSAWILREGLVPYNDAFLQKPPLVVYTYVISQFINPDALWPLRLIAAVFSLVTSLLVALITYREFGKKAASAALLLSVPLFAIPEFRFLAANTEVFMLLPLSILLLLFIWYKEKAPYYVWFLAGAFSSSAIMFKQICIPVIFSIFLWWIYQSWQITGARLLVLRNIFLAFLGLVIFGFIFTLPIILRGGLNNLWETAFIYNFYYLKAYRTGLFNLNLFVFFLRLSIIVIPISYFIFRSFKEQKSLFYLSLLGIAVVSVYKSPHTHYYLILIPFLIILWSASVTRIVQGRDYLFPYLVLISLAYVILSFNSKIFIQPSEFTKWVYPEEEPFIGAPTAAEKLSKNTGKDDYVFVAGSEPEILFGAKRKSSSRFVITYPLVINTPYRLKYQLEAIDDLKEKPPAAIVYVNSIYTGLWDSSAPSVFIDYLRNLIAQKYILVGQYVKRLDKDYWEDTLNADNDGKGTILLYKRKSNY